MTRKRKHPAYLVQTAGLTAVLFCIAGALSLAGAFSFLDWKLMDTAMRLHRSEPVHRDNVVFVCIDQKSIDFFDRDAQISWPWSRDFHGRLADYLASCGARAVVFDVIFSEQDIARDGLVRSETDDEFAAAIGQSGITFLAGVGQEETLTGTVLRESPLFIDDPGYIGNDSGFIRFESTLLPLPKFARNARGIGIANLEPDADGIHRRYPLVVKIGDRYAPSLGYSVVRELARAEGAPDPFERGLSEGVVDKQGMIHLNWYGSGGTGRRGENTDAVFNYYSYHAVLYSAIQPELGEEPLLPPETFRDKIVLVGSNAPGLFDLKATPFTHENLYPGMEIHATAIENMLAGEHLHVVSWGFVLAVIATVSLLFLAADKLIGNLRAFILVFVAMIAIELGASYAVLAARDIWIRAADIMSPTVIVFAGLVIAGYFRETREKRALRGHFGRYVNETVLREILDNPESVDFDGRIIRATIMATDIQGFTTISEQLPPREVVSRLNDYLSDVSEGLIDDGAFINKYIGDAILALFGAFDEPEHEKKALAAAIHAQAVFNRKIAEAERGGRTPFITRMGLATGEMTLGNIGSARKIEYTVIGDTVNTAFRFEGLNKYYGTRIVAGQDTRRAAGDAFEFRLLDTLRVKGKETPEDVYELLGFAGETDERMLRIRDSFEAAVEDYRARRFEDAKRAFDRLAGEGDQPSAVFSERCAAFIASPPDEGWSGVWIMNRK